MARITVEDCIDKFESRFELVLVASNRARKLHSGENPTVEKDNDKNTVIALREIADETIEINDMKNSLIEEYQTVSSQIEEDLSLEYTDLENNNENQEEKIVKIENDESVEAKDKINQDLKDENPVSEFEIDKNIVEKNTEYQTDNINENTEEDKN